MRSVITKPIRKVTANKKIVIKKRRGLSKTGRGVGAGAKSTYEDRYARMAYVACRDCNATDKMIADLLGVGKTAIKDWKRKHALFAAAFIEGRDDWNSKRCERALLKRSLGYDYEEVMVEEVKVDAVLEGATVKLPAKKIRVTKKHMPPDVSALMFQLTNRRKDRWQHVSKIDVDIESRHFGKIINEHKHKISLDMTQEEAADVYKKLLSGSVTDVDDVSR